MQSTMQLATETTDETRRSNGPMVELRQVDVVFGRNQVLRRVELSVPRGQTLAIIGESGCGKTVILKTIIGLIRPARGQVFFDGHDLATLTDEQLTHERTRFGFVFQQAALFDSMTVGQNVAFPLREHTKSSDAEMQEAVLLRLAEVGLPESIVSKKPAELSGGMRKRVGLARAIALRPKYLLYDEPTTGLDPVTSAVIDELMIRMREKLGVTSIVITHDMRSAYRVGTRIAMLYEGRVRRCGTVDEIRLSDDPVVRQFVEGRADIDLAGVV